MPRNRRPSFLTKQKEQQRRAKANEKREARRARKRAKPDTDSPLDVGEELPEGANGVDRTEDADGDEGVSERES